MYAKSASFGVAASKTTLVSFLTTELNTAPPRKADGGVRQSDSSLLSTPFHLYWKLKEEKTRYSSFSCPSPIRFVKRIASYWNTLVISPNHPQPSSLSSHVRGNYPNRQTGKVNFAAL
jgi:hypothetical protein